MPEDGKKLVTPRGEIEEGCIDRLAEDWLEPEIPDLTMASLILGIPLRFLLVAYRLMR